MSEPDRTAELVRAMLDRRAAAPAPTGLLDRTMHEIVLTPRRARAPRAGRPARAAALLLLVGVAAVAVAYGLGVGAAVPGAAGRPAEAATSGSPATASSSADAAPASPPPTASPAPVDSLAPAALRPGMTAIVTAAGDGLRVRTAPGVGQDYTKLDPLLRAGTRMQVLLGPVEADGYDWYEISTDADPGSGWVAAGKDGVAWIVAVAP